MMSRSAVSRRAAGVGVAAAFLLILAGSAGASPVSPPTSLTAVALSSSQIRLNWADSNTNESGFFVERSLSSTSGFTQIASLPTNSTTYTNSGLASGTTYYYRVRVSFKNGSYSTYSNVASARTTAVAPTPTPPPGTIPIAPSTLAAAPASTTQITLSWRDNSTNETGFKVERAPAAAGPWTYIGSTALTGYGDSGLAAATTYYYRVQAYNAYGNSAYTNTASATTQGAVSGVPAAPTGLTAAAVSSSQINLAWVDASTNETGFKIERAPSSTGAWTQIATTGTNVASYANTGLAASTAYWYRVRATNASGDSGYSNTASATTSGATGGGTGSYLWSTHFGGPTLGADSATPAGIVVDGSGASIVVGYLKGKADFGGGTLTSAGAGDVYLVKRASNGSFLWAQRFGSTEDDRPKGIAIDSSGNVFITGMFRGTVNFGGTALTAAPFTANGFLAKYSSTGAHIWSRRLATGINTDTGNAVAVDGSGNPIVAGSLFGTSDFGGGNLVSAGGEDVFLAKYSSAGGYLWSKRFGGASPDSATGIAADSTTGEVAVTGYFAGSVNFGGTTLTSAGGNDVFLAKYSSTGTHVWSRRWGSTSEDKGAAVAIDRLGNVVATGMFTNNVDFGGGPVANLGGAGSGDIFVVKISSTGVFQWAKGFGSSLTLNEVSYGVDVDDAGNVGITGAVVGTINFGGSTLTGDGWYNVFMAKFGSDGSHIWSKRFLGGGGNGEGRGIAFDGTANVLATGDYDVSENFGGLLLTSPGATDTYLVKFTP